MPGPNPQPAPIFGSGFLVIVPILNGVAGPYSVFAMGAVLAFITVFAVAAG